MIDDSFTARRLQRDFAQTVARLEALSPEGQATVATLLHALVVATDAESDALCALMKRMRTTQALALADDILRTHGISESPE